MTTEFSPPSQALLDVIERWHRHLHGDLPGGLDELLDDDAVLYSPVVFTPQRGKDIVKLYLMAAGQSFPGDAPGPAAEESTRFHYTKQLAGGDTAFLEFETTMGGKHVNGADIITVNDAGKIVEFRVMIRPLQAVQEVHRRMGAALDALANAAAQEH